MKKSDIFLLALGLGVAFVASRNNAAASVPAAAGSTGELMSAPAGATAQASSAPNSPLVETLMKKPGSSPVLFEGRPAVLSRTGIILADAEYKGRARITQNAQIQNIMTREGINTPMRVTDNPLVVEYQGVGGEVFRSSRSPSNEDERQEARKSNIRDLINNGAYTDKKAAELKEKYKL